MTSRENKYEPVPEDVGPTKLLPSKCSILGPQVRMAASILYSVLLMLLHHFWNRFLDGKAVSSSAHIIFGKRLTDQAISEVVGNGISYVVGTSLAAGIGVGFIQVLWLQLRRGRYTLREVDAMMSSKGGVFTPSSLLSWKCAFSLTLMGSSASLMSFIPIVTPGSLRVESSDFAFPSSCTVPTVSLSEANLSTIFLQPLSQNSNLSQAEVGLGGLNLQRFSEQVFLRGSPLPPPNPCSSDCKYDIRFNAPAAQCDQMLSHVFNESTMPTPDSDGRIVWWGQQSTSADTGGMVFQALSQSPLSSIDGADCLFYNATYNVTVTHSNSSSQVIVSSTELFFNEMIGPVQITSPGPVVVTTPVSKAIANTIQQYSQLVSSLWPVLETSIEYLDSTAKFQVVPSSAKNSTILAYSPVFERSLVDPWKMSCTVSEFLSSFLSNISVSLLSGALSTDQSPTTMPYTTTCWYSSARYTYDAERLLVTYGCGIGVAVLSMFFGFRAIRINGMEESTSFSRIIGATLNESLFEDRLELSRMSRVTGEGSLHGSLRLVPHSTFPTSTATQ